MIVTCPNCTTKFNLPDDRVSPQAKLRCSVCQHIFGIPDAQGHMPGQINQADAQNTDNMQENFAAGDTSQGEFSEDLDLDINAKQGSHRKKSHIVTYILIIILLCTLGGASALYYLRPDIIQPYLPFLNAGTLNNPKDMVSKISLRGVRQYSLNNEKLGTISIIEGKAVNGFAEPRELIKIEASLYDKDGNVLESKEQVAGTQASLFQLQVLGEKDLNHTLENKVDILTHNTNVPPGGEVPFMVVFFKSSENAAEFGVKVIEAKLPPR